MASLKTIFFSLLTGLVLAIAPKISIADELVIFTVPQGLEFQAPILDQVNEWIRSGIISDAEVLQGVQDHDAQFGLLGILYFGHPGARQNWLSNFSGRFPAGTELAEVDELAKLGSSSRDSSGTVFQVMEYEVLVDRLEFEDYIDGYQLAEMRMRHQNGGLKRYSSFYAGPGSSMSWQSLIIMEYRDEAALAASTEVNKALGQELMKRDPRFASFKLTKDGIRTKTGTTLAHAMALNP